MLSFAFAAIAMLAAPVPPAASVHNHSAPAGASMAVLDSLRGQVVDSTGGGIGGVQVTLVELARRTTTNQRGAFAFADVPAGRYTLVARRVGYAAVSDTVRVGRVAVIVADQFGVRPQAILRLTRLATDIEPVVVTATRDATDVSRSPFPVEQLSGDRLQREQSFSLSGATDGLAGVHNLTTGQQIGKPVIRGLSGARVLVLDDGHRLEDYSWSDEDGPSIDARLAQRVEVIRGPASVLYGSDAIGGVINAVPAALPDASGGNFVRSTAELTGATNNREGGLLLGAEGAHSRIGWRATAIARFSEDMNTPDGKLENTKYSSVTGEAAAAYHSSRGTSTLRYARYGCECHLLEANEPPKPPGGGEEEGGPERKAGDDRVQYTGNYVAGKFRLEPKLQWQRHSLAEVSDELGPGGQPTGTESEVFNLLLNTTTADLLLHHGEGGKVHGTLGISGQYQTSDSRGIIPLVPDARLTAGGLFGFEQIDLGNVSLTGAARGDANALHADANAELGVTDQSRNTSAFSGDVGVIVRPARDLALTANVGRAFRSPTLFELFANGPRLGEARYEIGDPTLDPETSLNLDGSIRWGNQRVRAEVAGFHNRIENFIYIAPTGEQQGTLDVYRYEHALATLYGGEVSADVDPMRMLTLRARYDVVRGTNEDTNEPLPLIPPPRTTLEAELHGVALGWADNAHAGLDVEINAKQTHLGPFDTATDGYTLLGLDAGIARRLGSRPIRFDIRVRNLTDKAYKSFLSRYKSFALDPGRNVLLKLSMDF
jgi:outer membrane receptor protein involved in Fe transport